ncbi:hypothetical protein LCGC14_2939550 [marine sediment metagenome]|uniref:Uncharacterized protein n=1 Tax=marine sediment metagenome TaxID=412755 RepID=A0A0F8XJ35_9ZZZZ
MAKKSTRSKKTKVKSCPPAIADGIKTTAEVKPIKRPRGQGPRKLIKKGPRLKKKKGRTKKWIEPEPVVSNKPKRPNHLPWTTKSRRILNEQKDRMARRKRLSVNTKKRLEAANKRRMKRLRRRLHDLFTHD